MSWGRRWYVSIILKGGQRVDLPFKDRAEAERQHVLFVESWQDSTANAFGVFSTGHPLGELHPIACVVNAEVAAIYVGSR